MTSRAELSRLFLAQNGYDHWQRRFLAGDASPRSYDRLSLGDKTLVLMDAPPERGEDVRPFVKMASHLHSLGLSAPEILAADEQNGFLLLEDLGDDLYARVLDRGADPAALYKTALQALHILQKAPPPAGLPAHSPGFMADAAGLAFSWYARAITGEAQDPAPLVAAMAEAMSAHCTQVPVLVLRDYHAENLLWLPGREGAARAGLLDFQMGSLGQPEYDVISLLQDARRDVDPAFADAMIADYAGLRGADPNQTALACAVLGAQRNLRILGGFTRLSLHFGKPGYVKLIPRVWGYLLRCLARPELAELREIAARLPAPDATALKRIEDLCGTCPDP